jgi:hypothetical protein
MFEQPQYSQEMEPVVLIDKSKNKEAHVIVPMNYTFADMIATAKRINPEMFDGAWQLSFLNPQTKKPEILSQDASVGLFISQGIDTFYWNYAKPSFKFSLPSDQNSQQNSWQTKQRDAVYGQQERKHREWEEQNANEGFGRRGSGNKATVANNYTVQYADIAKRAIAFLIDLFVLGVILGMSKGNGMGLFVWWLYYAVMESSNMQGTFGKMAMGLKVTDMNGRRVSFGKATARYFLKWVSSAIAGIGYLFPFFTEKRQALHDLLSGCLVVEKK